MLVETRNNHSWRQAIENENWSISSAVRVQVRAHRDDFVEDRVEHAIHNAEIVVERCVVVLQVLGRREREIILLKERNNGPAPRWRHVGPAMAHLHVVQHVLGKEGPQEEVRAVVDEGVGDCAYNDDRHLDHAHMVPCRHFADKSGIKVVLLKASCKLRNWPHEEVGVVQDQMKKPTCDLHKEEGIHEVHEGTKRGNLPGLDRRTGDVNAENHVHAFQWCDPPGIDWVEVLP